VLFRSQPPASLAASEAQATAADIVEPAETRPAAQPVEEVETITSLDVSAAQSLDVTAAPPPIATIKTAEPVDAISPAPAKTIALETQDLITPQAVEIDIQPTQVATLDIQPLAEDAVAPTLVPPSPIDEAIAASPARTPPPPKPRPTRQSAASRDTLINNAVAPHPSASQTSRGLAKQLAAIAPSAAGNSGSKSATDAGGHALPEGDGSRQSGGGGSPGETADYMMQLQAWLERHKGYPRRARLRHQEGTALLYFVMDGNGRVLEYRLEKSSGHALLDREVKEMIERAQPLPRIPEHMQQTRLELVVPVRFSLH